jgi:hypothetical protein
MLPKKFALPHSRATAIKARLLMLLKLMKENSFLKSKNIVPD